MDILTIDPSINHLGWAFLAQDDKVASYNFLRVYGTIDAPTEFKQEELVYRIDWIIGELDETTLMFQFDTIAIECPEPWGAYKSMASSRSGSLQMLTLVVGALTHWAIQRVGVDSVKLIKVSTWKGQLPKAVTKRRMEKKYNCTFRTSDEADAVGLGDYVFNLDSTVRR